MKWNLKIYKKNGKIKKLDCGIVQDIGFDKIGCLSIYYFKFDVDQCFEIELCLICLICCGFYIIYVELQIKFFEFYFEILLLYNLELEYVWECVYLIGFRVID